MIDGGRSVVRMFSHQPHTVRWETRLRGDRGLELTVRGPGALKRFLAFKDAPTLVDYQVQVQRQLLMSGFEVLPEPERRKAADRRRHDRTAVDRRTQ